MHLWMRFLNCHTSQCGAFKFLRHFENIKRQKQPSRGVLQERCLQKFRKIYRKHLYQGFFNEVVGLWHWLWHRCFPVDFAKFLRAPILTEHIKQTLHFLLTGVHHFISVSFFFFFFEMKKNNSKRFPFFCSKKKRVNG